MIADPEVRLAFAYAPGSTRPALEALWLLDAQFAAIVRSTTEPMIGEMRLTWWHDALNDLPSGEAPAEPLLQRLRTDLAGSAADFTELAGMADGWSALLDPMPLSGEQLLNFAQRRGGILFAQAAAVLGLQQFHAVNAGGQGWALADFAFRCTDRETAGKAMELARTVLQPALAQRWPKAARPLGILAHLALMDARNGLAAPRHQGAPRRLLRAIWHTLTGR